MEQTAENLCLSEEIKNDNKIVTGWLLQYHERRKEYYLRREAIIHSTPRPEGENGGQTFKISDSTGGKGTKLADMADIEQWLKLVEEVEQRLPWKMQIILKLRREAAYIKSRRRGRPAWVAYVQVKYCEEIAQRTSKQLEDVWVDGERTFKDWWNRIVEYTARIAAKRGLLKN